MILYNCEIYKQMEEWAFSIDKYYASIMKLLYNRSKLKQKADMLNATSGNYKSEGIAKIYNEIEQIDKMCEQARKTIELLQNNIDSARMDLQN